MGNVKELESKVEVQAKLTEEKAQLALEEAQRKLEAEKEKEKEDVKLIQEGLNREEFLKQMLKKKDVQMEMMANKSKEELRIEINKMQQVLVMTEAKLKDVQIKAEQDAESAAGTLKKEKESAAEYIASLLLMIKGLKKELSGEQTTNADLKRALLLAKQQTEVAEESMVELGEHDESERVEDARAMGRMVGYAVEGLAKKLVQDEVMVVQMRRKTTIAVTKAAPAATTTAAKKASSTAASTAAAAKEPETTTVTPKPETLKPVKLKFEFEIDPNDLPNGH